MKERKLSCKKFIGKMNDPKCVVKCVTCQHNKECNSEEMKFDIHDRMMRTNRGIYIE